MANLHIDMVISVIGPHVKDNYSSSNAGRRELEPGAATEN